MTNAEFSSFVGGMFCGAALLLLCLLLLADARQRGAGQALGCERAACDCVYECQP